ncbi:MAG: hypothetical protein FK730_01570 [Asgard group archaeon]|nr:hypothetical protein [Asgard group archaeon]
MNFQNDISIDADEENLNDNANFENIRCLWCNSESLEESKLMKRELYKRGKEIPSEFWTCSEEHEIRIRKYFGYIEKIYFLYMIFVFLFPIVLIGLTIIFRNLYYTFGGVISLGVGLTILPLIGNQIMYNFGIKRTNILGRILGGMLILIGLSLILIFGFDLFNST